MRLIGTLQSENTARKFSHFLHERGIEATVDVQFDANSGLLAYQVWVHDEDRLHDATALLSEFEHSPDDRRYDLPPEPLPPGPPPKRRRPILTILITALCVFLYILDVTQEVPLLEKGIKQDTFLFTPLQSQLLYDFPAPFKTFIQNPTEQGLVDLQRAPYFQGIYTRFVATFRGDNVAAVEGPLFTDIRNGEVYRLITPIFLHGGFLHILFNLLWFWVLAGPIEERIGLSRTLLLIGAIALLSNTAQYLMSGPFFLGISGVVAGLAGYMWMRQKLAPWEGYPMQRSTFLFLALFLVAMFGLSVFSFFTQSFTNLPLTPNIANTAHLVGAALGMILGRLHFFARSVR